jgi:SAM-dependent methyltransferase
MNSHALEAQEATAALQPSPWEAAYLRFETPEEEIRKFVRRLDQLGARQWPRDWRIVEIFCGRGNGLHALAQFGFTNLEGVDLSPALAARYSGPARVTVADCRNMPFDSNSKDVLIVQGGLHHLPELPADLETTLREAQRVLKPGGLFCAVEPWLSPFLSFVHAVANIRFARRLSQKVDAFAVMTEHERITYERWLSQPDLIRATLDRFFAHRFLKVQWGKLLFVGEKRTTNSVG